MNKDFFRFEKEAKMAQEEVNWASKTGRFGAEGLAKLRDSTAAELIQTFHGLDGIAVVHAMAELLAHREEIKLRKVNEDDDVRKKWRSTIVPFGQDMIWLLALTIFFEKEN